MREFLYERNHVATFTESLNNSDILSLTRSFYSHEVEIKTTKSDLLRELNVIDFVFDRGIKGARISPTKLEKHERYLKDKWKQMGWTKPNYFSFCVPFELSYLIQNEFRLEETPYGLIVFNERYDIPEDYTIDIKIKPKLMHKEKVKVDDLWGLVRKACTESVELRKKLDRVKKALKSEFST